MMQFTPEQHAALDLHVHCAVHANAGSGKTSVVTHRFVKILIETATPLDQIIAITFTRAAAAEMRERIHRLLADAQNSPELRASFASHLSDDQLVRQLREWAANISTARISTFHSFCAGVVRQYAEELELDAEIRELDAADASALVDDAVRRTITEHLRPTSQRASALTSVFDDVAIDTVRAIIAHATRDSSFAAALASDPQHTRMERRRTWVSQQSLVIARDALQLFEEHLLPLSDIPAIADLLERAKHLKVRCADPDDHQVASEIEKLYTKTFTTKHEIRAALIPKDLRASIPTLPVASAELRALLPVLATPWDDIQEQRLDEILDVLEEVVCDARDRYRTLKREMNAIDFDDMIHYTLELLTDASIASALGKSVRYIMVDEFQDTDPLQYEVLSRIAPALRGDHAQTPNVYIVGDDKQSIYGFRDADVRLFRRATYALQQANQHHGTDTGYRPLVTSFRMHHRVAASVNAICSAMFGAVATPPITDTTSYDVGYQPLRSIPSHVESDHIGTCSVVTTMRDFSEAIAHVVASMLNGTIRRDIAMHDRVSGTWSTRTAQPSDIAILVQTNPQVVQVGEALSRLGIPVDLHGGASFFSRPEVVDLRALLTACVAPTDNLAVATVCRSPLLRCTDADIASAALRGRRSSMRDGIAQCVADGVASPELARAHALLSTWEVASVRLTPAELVQRALDESGWYATLAREDRREQIRANVEKVLDIIRDAVDGTGGTLYDAVTALSPIDGDRERDGFVPSDGNAVRVMTIHASKGLEFGVVVLGGLATQPRPYTFITGDPLGLSFAIATTRIDPESPGSIMELPSLKSHAVMKLQQRQRDMAEYRRRLYVALTRAKMHIVMMHDDEEIDGSLPGMAGVLGEALATTLSHVTVLPDRDSTPYEGTQVQREQIVLLDRLPTPLPELISPTQFLDAHRWTDGDDRPMDADAAGAAYGIAVHDVLASTLPDLLRCLPDERLGIIARALATHQLDRTRAAEAALEITALLDTPLVREHNALLQSARREVRLVAALDDVVVQGILDCRLAHDDGSISVWDWKTNAVRNEADLDELAQVYHRQMQTYAWLCFRAYPECPTVTTRLVFTKAVVYGIAVSDRPLVWHRKDVDAMTDALRSALADLLARSNS